MIYLVAFLVGALIVANVLLFIFYRGNKQAAAYITAQNERIEKLNWLVTNQRALIFGFRRALPGFTQLVKHTPGGGGSVGVPPTKQEVEVLAQRCKHLKQMVDEYDAAGGQQAVERLPVTASE